MFAGLVKCLPCLTSSAGTNPATMSAKVSRATSTSAIVDPKISRATSTSAPVDAKASQSMSTAAAIEVISEADKAAAEHEVATMVAAEAIRTALSSVSLQEPSLDAPYDTSGRASTAYTLSARNSVVGVHISSESTRGPAQRSVSFTADVGHAPRMSNAAPSAPPKPQASVPEAVVEAVTEGALDAKPTASAVVEPEAATATSAPAPAPAPRGSRSATVSARDLISKFEETKDDVPVFMQPQDEA